MESSLSSDEPLGNQENDDDGSLFFGASIDNDIEITERLKTLNKEQDAANSGRTSLAHLSQQQEPEGQAYKYLRQHPITFSVVLPYQKRIITDMIKSDGLLILARGMGYLKVASNLIHALDVSGISISQKLLGEKVQPNQQKQNLVICLGMKDGESETISQELRELSVIDQYYTSDKRGPPYRTRGFTIINTESTGTISKRKSIYMQGGVFFVTARIFVVDLLCHVIDPTVISGIIVGHAEQVTETSTISFILRLYRQQNKVGFIKALSEDPERFTGFSPLSTVMKTLHINKTFLWPRFHVSITDSVDLQHLVYLNVRTGQWTKPMVADVKSVIEIKVQLTPSMAKIQQAILSCIESCISNIRKTNSKIIEMEEWNLDNALSSKFDFIIRRQLEPFWHLISPRTKTNVHDLSVLRELLSALLNLNSISFFRTVSTMWSSNLAGLEKGDGDSWVFFDDADTLFAAAKERVFGSDASKSQSATKISDESKYLCHNGPEELPKWDQLAKILEEISSGSKLGNSGPILIMCSMRSTIHQLSLYLKLAKKVESSGSSFYSGRDYMNMELRRYSEWKYGDRKIRKDLSLKSINRSDKPKVADTATHSTSTYNKRRRVRGGSQVAGNSRPNTQQSSTFGSKDQPELDADELQVLEGMASGSHDQDDIDVVVTEVGNACTILDSGDLVIIQAYDQADLELLLPEFQPSHIIMYEPNLAFIRHVEVYRSSNPFSQVKVYFMYYGDSVEEQNYLGSVRREKESFTRLIREKSNLPAIIVDDLNEGTSDGKFRHIAAIANKTTRLAGGQLPLHSDPIVIVDFREFRSSLPFCLHTNKMGVLPVMLTVGDYILSPRICVERKSIPDLVSSFKDGRIFTQCEGMFRYYEKPVLLIEFDESKSFSLEPFSEISSRPTNGLASHSAISSEATKMIQEKLQSRLMLLLLQFPRLRIIWSMSPRHTAEVIYELKLLDPEQPDPITAGKCGIDSTTLISKSDQKFNQSAIDILKSIPGINPQNFRTVIDNVKSLQDLCVISEDSLAGLIGPGNARQVKLFLNRNLLY